MSSSSSHASLLLTSDMRYGATPPRTPGSDMCVDDLASINWDKHWPVVVM